MSWQMPWTVFDSFGNIASNLSDGYQFGDFTKGWFGWNDNRSSPASAKEVQSSFNYDEPLSFEDFTGQDYSLGSKFKNLFTGKLTSAEKNYQNYLSGFEFRKNQEATAKANQETWAREDTQVQRLMEDYFKAGLNPYLILNNGNLSSGVVSSRSKSATYKKKALEEGNAESKLMNTAIKVLALVLLKKAL